MTLRTVLTMLEGADRDTIDLEAARHLAADFGCHVDLLHVRRDGLSAMPMVGEGLSADLIEMVQAQVEKEEAAIADKCRAIFDKWMKDNNIASGASPSAAQKASARLIDVVGQSGEEIARHGKHADLVVLRSPSVDDGDLSPAAEAAIYDTGRPVLFSPRQELKTLGKRVSVFWNDTVEASRAAQAAMPFMKRADAVQIMAVDDDSFDPQTVADYAASLGWHDIKAEATLVKPDSRSAGEALLDAAWDNEADLIVMGAFSHSRLREMILGGVTQHILKVAGRPVLMMH
jgi:nucleotide-binding universal stress UspA family protein